jgi:hypothetical protein
MKRIVRLTESELMKLVGRIVKEQEEMEDDENAFNEHMITLDHIANHFNRNTTEEELDFMIDEIEYEVGSAMKEELLSDEELDELVDYAEFLIDELVSEFRLNQDFNSDLQEGTKGKKPRAIKSRRSGIKTQKTIDQNNKVLRKLMVEADEKMEMIQQATQDFNEEAEEDLTPDEFQEVACVHPDSLELPASAPADQKQTFEEFKTAVKTAVKNRDVTALKQAKRQLKELKRKSKQQNEQVVTGTLYTVIGIQMPLGFVIFTYGFLLLLILNGLLSIFGIHLIKNITDWCTGRRTVGYGIRFGRD